ncbi:MAG TPA: biotin--[acetyl-CoA-carboxylase] ligase [Candidatus Eisenbacteria bacterium]|nr:biotin--[acetyl-CoA-carboxylase] ligase [Candidatus Eisenbacteria bacterium]
MPSGAADQILAWLRAASAPLSGEELAQRLGVSRAAVFKHVEALRGRGYTIDARHAQGYVLAGTPDRLDAVELGPHLTGTWRRIEWHGEIDSTQRAARDLARAGAAEGTTVVAEAQTAGRGRLGRSWHSPPGVNVYCSLVLRPALAPGVVPQLGLVLGLAVAVAVREATGLAPMLKWPNDVLVGGRKIVGILTEMEAELERVHFVVAGIGVNVNAPADAFPDDLRDKVTSLAIATGRPVDRVAFMARLLATLETYYRRFADGGFGPLRPEWEGLSALTGRTVVVRAPEGDLGGRVEGLDDDGALRLVDAEGTARRVVAGEVTIRDGYGT